MELENLNKSVISSQSGEDRVSLFTQINELRALAQKQIMKNQMVYNLLLQNDIPVNFKPYLTTIPKIKLTKDNEIESQKQRLIYLNDLVLSQAHQLEKYKYKFENKLHELQNQKQELSMKFQNAYMFMRKAWSNQNTFIINDPIISSETQLEKLNKIIISLKNNAQRIIIQQRKTNSQYYNNKSAVEDLLEVDAYVKLKEKYERSIMSQEDPIISSSRNICKQSHLKKQIQQYQKIIKQLQKQNQSLKDQVFQSQKKIKKLENQLIKTQSKMQQNMEKLNKINYQNQNRQKKMRIICKNDKSKFEILLFQNLITIPFENNIFPIQTNQNLDEIIQFFSAQAHKPNINSYETQKEKQPNLTDSNQNRQPEVEVQVRPRKQSRCTNRISNIQFKPEDISEMKFRRTNTIATNIINHRLKKEGEDSSTHMNFYTKMDKLTEQE